ncbi:hypothetical protein F2Q69_00034133 [Brassica cretica]|uniref:Uncharacterized protein n=1 Tax=Brassica cretica TaxID=69181 RepID=A0A8S9SK45_BRACR|nr:hypothetical protein F2Q69_00034133 [Brassica cretica]
MTNIPPANELRQEMTAALTDQVQILRDLLVQLRALTRSTLRAPDVTAEENTPTTERTNKRRNIRNPERRNQGNRARILYIGGGPSPSILTVAQQQSYCQYHRCAGHETTCCRQLKDVLFGKYQRGEISVQNYNPSGFNTLNLWNLRQQLRQENPRPIIFCVVWWLANTPSSFLRWLALDRGISRVIPHLLTIHSFHSSSRSAIAFSVHIKHPAKAILPVLGVSRSDATQPRKGSKTRAECHHHIGVSGSPTP